MDTLPVTTNKGNKMSATVIDLSVFDLATLERIARSVTGDDQKKVLDVIALRNASKVADAQALTEQEFYTLPDGSKVSKTVLEMLGYSSLGGNAKKPEPDTAHGKAKSGAWDFLHALKNAYKVQGFDYQLTPEGFKSRATGNLSVK